MPLSEEEDRLKRNQYALDWKWKHIEQVRAADRVSHKIYSVTHKKEISLRNKKYRAENSDKIKAHLEQNKERIKLRGLEYRKRVLSQYEPQIQKLFPSLSCIFCGRHDYDACFGISFHEIYGKNHIRDQFRKFEYIIKHHNDFVPICNSHHQKCHWLMKNGLGWERIREILLADMENSKMQAANQ